MPEWLSLIFGFKDRKSKDKLGLYPLKIHTGAFPERRYLWTSRIMVILGAISLSVTMMLAMTIYVLLPQRGSSPKLYHAQTYNSSLREARPAEVFASSEQIQTEKVIRRYITLRHEFPRSYADLAYRWNSNSEFYQLTSLSVYYEFTHKMNYKTMSSMVEKKIARDVKIDWVRQLTNTLWVAQFETYTTSSTTQTPVKAVWRAYMRIDNKQFDADTTSAEYLHNPHGIIIKKYSLGYVGDGSQADDYMTSAKKIVEKRQ